MKFIFCVFEDEKEILEILKKKDIRLLQIYIDKHDTQSCFDFFIKILENGLIEYDLFVAACFCLFFGLTNLNSRTEITEIDIVLLESKIQYPLKDYDICNYIYIDEHLQTSYSYYDGYEEGDENNYDFESVVSNTDIGGICRLILELPNKKIVTLASEHYYYSSYGGGNDIVFSYQTN